ncbi:hypothetical protein DSO57_1009513 [Entomophthora muscae]|uniref:Uncharacterized protein n=1 Tax=Entomophthora muscae TaxID=34485 RepID=A0ACC2UTT5_9FUNG|nr:hypothetical protein DSO57_1009513 [Entomophthora muscae]
MELQHRGNLLKVDTGCAAIVCDQCRRVRRKCNRGVHSCNRCLGRRIECTRHQNKLTNIFVGGSTRASWAPRIKKAVVPTTWTQAIEVYPGTTRARLYIRGYVLPLVYFLPSPSLLGEIMAMANGIIQPRPLSFESKVLLQIQYAQTKIQDAFERAINIFFHMCNPFLPLFSEEAFHAHSRSQLYVRLSFKQA